MKKRESFLPSFVLRRKRIGDLLTRECRYLPLKRITGFTIFKSKVISL